MRVVKRRSDFVGDAERVVDWKLFLAVEPVAQRTTRDKWRDVIERSVGFARVDQGNDVWMRQARSDADLAKKSLGADRGAELLLQDFDRDFALVLLLFGEVNCCHATVAEEALDRVAVGERAGEGEGGAHGRNIGGGQIAGPPAASV